MSEPFPFRLPVLACLAALLLAASGARGVQAPPDDQVFFFQTNAPDGQVGFGDWYSSNAPGAGNGFHYLAFYVPCSWPPDLPVMVDLFSPGLNENLVNDEIAGTASRTVFELYGPGTGYASPATPGPGAPGSIVQQGYDPTPDPDWRRLRTLTPPVTCGQYLLRAETELGGDQNSWQLRVYADDDDDPNNTVPPLSDNPDGLPGTDDELTIGQLQMTYEERSDQDCETLYQYVQPDLAFLRFHNFDIDGDIRVRYFSPRQAVDPEGLSGGFPGTVSGQTVWNGGTLADRGDDDLVLSPESGWWALVTCVTDNNQFVQEGQTGVPTFFRVPPTPFLAIDKDDNTAEAFPGDTVEYTVRFENTSDQTANPGAATSVRFTDTLPAGVSYESCAIDPPFTGTCSETGGLVTLALSEPVLPGERGAVRVTVSVDASAVFPLENLVRVDYADSQQVNNFVNTATALTFSSAALSLDKSVTPAAGSAGDVVQYAFEITNPSELPVQLASLEDNRLGPLTIPQDRNLPDLLYQFDDDATPATVEDVGVEPPDLALVVEDPGNVIYNLPDRLTIPSAANPTRLSLPAADAPALNQVCIANSEVSIEAWIDPANGTQSGVIAAIADASGVNLELVQDGSEYVFRARTSTSGVAEVRSGVNVAEPGLVQVVGVRSDLGVVRLFVNKGADPFDPVPLDAASLGDFSTWDDSRPLVLANAPGVASTDPTDAWVGDYVRVGVYCEAITAREISEAFAFGPAEDLGASQVLLAGESAVVTSNYELMASDLPGPLENTAVVAGRAPEGLSAGAVDEASVALVPSSLAVDKRALPAGGTILAPADPVTYTIEITNDGTERSTGIVLADALPEGLAYVPGSTVVEGFRFTRFEVLDDFTDNAYDQASVVNPPDDWDGPWVEENTGDDGPFALLADFDEKDISIPISPFGDGNAQDQLLLDPNDGSSNLTDDVWITRPVDLSSFAPGDAVELRFDYQFFGGTEPCGLSRPVDPAVVTGGSASSARDCLFVRVSSDDTTYATVDFLGGSAAENPAVGDQYVVDISSVAGGTAWIRFRAEGLRQGEAIALDNVRIVGERSASVTLGNAPGGANPDLDDGDPPALVTAADGLTLAPGQSMTVTFQATVDDPVPPTVSSIRNVAVADSLEAPPALDEVIHPIQPRGLIGDKVWFDADGDGVFDVGEAGLGNVSVELVDPDDGTVLATTLTDSEGDYAFLRLAAGAYAVRVATGAVPAEFAPTAGNPSGGYALTLVVGAADRSADFGYVLADAATGALGDTVFGDADGNGRRDPGEPGIAGVSVALLDAAGDVVATTTTGADGGYRFTGLVPAKYRARVQVPAGYAATTPALTGPLSVEAGGLNGTADFGLRDPSLATITERVWFDTDGDGARDFDEGDFVGIQFNLLDAGGALVASTVSDAQGAVRFAGVPDGAYTIVLVGASSEANLAGGISRLEPTTPAAEAFTLAVTVAGGDLAGESFGFNQAGFLGDTVFVDADGDGVQDPGEPGFGQVALTVYRNDGDGTFDPPAAQQGPTADEPVEFTTTSADGRYSFEALPFGSFIVAVDVGAANGSLYDDYVLTSTDDLGAGPGVNGAQRVAVLNAGNGGDNTLDFGFRADGAATFAVSGTVFEDANRNGRQDGEAGIAGVVVDLVAADGLVIATTSTDGAGGYTFEGLATTRLDGSAIESYTVRVADTADVLTGFSLTAGLDTQTVAVPADGSDVTALDFGYARATNTASIGDLVWLDADGDGARDGGEPGVAGVSIELLDSGADGQCGAGDPIVATAVTDALGSYAFDGLASGIYCVAFDPGTFPPGTGAGGPTPSALILLTDGENFDTADLPLVVPGGLALLGDRVYVDADGDRTEDPGELGIPGVTVDLVSFGVDGDPATDDGDLTLSSTTDARGYYGFPDLPAQTYYVTVDVSTVPAGYAASNPDASNLTYVVAVEGARAYTLLDYGFRPGTPLGSITQTIFSDGDNDGARQPGEPGLAQVSVDLLDDQGRVLATALSDPAGEVSFTGVPDGAYVLRVSDTGGITAGLARTTPAGGPIPVSVAGAAAVVAPDVGYGTFSGPRGTIGDLVWHDADGDGIRQPEESGIENVAVELWLDEDTDGAIQPGIDNRVRTVVTDANGGYQFAGLGLADYLVTVRAGEPMLAGFDPVVGGQSRQQPHAVEISVAKLLKRFGGPAAVPKVLEVASADFGYRAPVAFELSGTVFDDASNDGVLQLGELGIEGATVLLYRDLDGDGVIDPEDGLLGATRAAGDGEYGFDNLPPGDYLVTAAVDSTLAENYFQTTQQGTRGVAAVPVSGAGASADFGFYNGGVTTTPVELAYVHVRAVDEGVALAWSTASEYDNAAFQWYVAGRDGRMRRAGELVPSRAVTSTRWLDYELVLGPEALGEQYWIQDLSTTGEVTLRGPFALGERWGERFASEPIDWSHVRVALAQGAGTASPRLARRTGAPAVDLVVERAGLHVVTGAALRAAGIPLESLATDALALTTGGEPVPLHLGCATPTVTPDCPILFVGEPEKTLYRDERVYRLTLDRNAARRMTIFDGRSTTVDASATRRTVLERAEDRAYDYASPGREPWYLQRLLAVGGRTATAAFDFDLGTARAADEPVLEVLSWGLTDLPNHEDHRVGVRVNGELVAERTADGTTPIEFEVPLAAGQWIPGANRITVEARANDGAPFSIVHLDAVRLRYREAPTLRDGNEILALDLAQVELVERPPAGSDFLFGDGFERSATVTVGDGFLLGGLGSDDELFVVALDGEDQMLLRGAVLRPAGAGFEAEIPPGVVGRRVAVATASALREPAVRLPALDPTLLDEPVDHLMIAAPGLAAALDPLVAWHEGQGLAVRVVTTDAIFDTFGDGHFGPEAIERYIAALHARHPLSFVLLAGADSFDYRNDVSDSVSLIPTRYARVHPVVRYAPTDALLVDLDGDEVPDLPIGRFPARTPAELAAMVAKTLTYAGNPGGAALLAADRDERFAPYSRISDTVAQRLLPGFGITRAYLTELTPAQARARIVDTVNAGVSLTHFFGHSAFQLWGLTDVLLNTDDVRGLTNGADPTVVMQWGCWNTYFVDYRANTLAHAWLTGPSGAAAVLGPTSLTRVSSEQLLGNLFLPEATSAGLPLGTALMLAKQALAQAHGDVADVVLGYTLLGDPALELR